MRVRQQPAYLLHARPFSETSLLVDLFSKEHGRLRVLAKGARRRKSRARGLLLPFKPLLVDWAGKGRLPVLAAVEQCGHVAQMGGALLASGFYVNELLLRLLHMNDAHEALFERYGVAVAGLAGGGDPRRVLRIFEKNLLAHIGFGVVLERDAESGEAIVADRRYRYVPEKGPVRVGDDGGGSGLMLSGGALCALRDERLESDEQLVQARRLTRVLIDRQLGGRGLRSRRVLGEMNKLREDWGVVRAE